MRDIFNGLRSWFSGGNASDDQEELTEGEAVTGDQAGESKEVVTDISNQEDIAREGNDTQKNQSLRRA